MIYPRFRRPPFLVITWYKSYTNRWGIRLFISKNPIRFCITSLHKSLYLGETISWWSKVVKSGQFSPKVVKNYPKLHIELTTFDHFWG